MKNILMISMVAGLMLMGGYGNALEIPPEKLMAFADHLFEKSDYYRAITEYERIVFHFPDHRLAPKARFQIAMSYYRGEKWDQAADRFKELVERYPDDGGIRRDSHLMLAECHAKRNDYRSAVDVLEKYLTQHGGGPQADQVRLILGKNLLSLGEWEKAGEVYRSVPVNSPIHKKAMELAELSGRYGEIPGKSPLLAGVLSAAIPGAGQLYVESPKDAVASFLLNALFIWATVESFDRGSNVTGGLLLSIESVWYAGNIYNAASGAHKYNRRAKQNFLNRFNGNLRVSFRRDNIMGSWLALSMSF